MNICLNMHFCIFNDLLTLFSIMVSQSIPGPKSYEILEKKKTLNQLIMIGSLMELQSISRPEGFFAEVAGDNNSFNMIRFNVIFYGTSHPLLSTNFATMGQVIGVCIFIFTFLHHRLHHLLKLV